LGLLAQNDGTPVLVLADRHAALSAHPDPGDRCLAREESVEDGHCRLLGSSVACLASSHYAEKPMDVSANLAVAIGLLDFRDSREDAPIARDRRTGEYEWQLQGR